MAGNLTKHFDSWFFLLHIFCNFFRCACHMLFLNIYYESFASDDYSSTLRKIIFSIIFELQQIRPLCCSCVRQVKTSQSRGRGFDSQPEGLGVAFFITGPGLGLIMYILTTLEFPTHNINFHLLTTSVNAKYYYQV